MQLRWRSLAPVLLAILFLIVSSAFLSAQKLPEIDAYGGVSYVRFDTPPLGFTSDSNLVGFAASITAPHLYQALGLTINADGDYGSPLKVYNFILGPQLTGERGRFRYFGNLLFGKAETMVTINQPTRSEITSVGRAVALGGGLDMKLSRHHLAVRLFDVDYVYSKTFNSVQNNLRVSGGLVYEFGRK
jgi:hypothetical protein